VTSLIGRRLGRYEIRAEIGRGGMARVFSALDTQLQRTVAIKVLAAQLSMDEEFVRRFEREARTAASLRHPALVTIYDVGEQDGLHFIAMEYVAGRSLHTILEERTALGLGFAVSILEPVAQALDYAHSQGAVHRDIKPHNILIDRGGRVLLTDFGIAQTAEADSERLTRTGVFMGTPEYISPEQAEARRVDGRSDLYSLGVVAYEIVTGRVPFSGATPQLIVAHAQLPPPPPTAVMAHLPGELDELLAKALAKRPERRFASGAALVEALAAVARRYDTPLASREQLAVLAGAEEPAGGGTAAIPPPRPPARPVPPRERQPRAEPAAPPRPLPVLDPPRTGPTRPQAAEARPARPATAARPPMPRPAPRAQPFPPDEPRRRPSSAAPLLLIGALLVALTLALVFVAARGLANPIRFPTAQPTAAQLPPSPVLAGTAQPVTSTPTDAPTETATSEPTVEPTLAPTEGPAPTLPPPPPPSTATRAPTAPPRPTSTPAPPSSTPAPPTDTPAPPTDTPSPTDAPTSTPTPTATPSPTFTSSPTAFPTETAVLSETVTVVTPIVTSDNTVAP